jgi:hypothetical protein
MIPYTLRSCNSSFPDNQLTEGYSIFSVEKALSKSNIPYIENCCNKGDYIVPREHELPDNQGFEK